MQVAERAQNQVLPSSNDASSALDVIIEAEVSVAHLFQDGKCLICLEVLKLDQAVGKAVLCRCTELFNHLHMLFTCQTLLFGALHQQAQLSFGLCAAQNPQQLACAPLLLAASAWSPAKGFCKFCSAKIIKAGQKLAYQRRVLCTWLFICAVSCSISMVTSCAKDTFITCQKTSSEGSVSQVLVH